jgi:hypothetical protein
MKPKKAFLVFLFTWLFYDSPSTLLAEYSPRSTGIGIRASYWALPESRNYVSTSFPNGTNKIDVGGPGGWLYLVKRVNDNLIVELSFGGAGSVKGETSDLDEYDGHFYHHSHHDDDDQKNLNIAAITPALFGMRYFPLACRSRAGFQPYVSAGIGPYFIADIMVRDDGFTEEITTSWQTKAGSYLGGGVDINLTNWLALNLDARYHLVDFDANNEYSNIEWGLGLQFMWGKWR